MALTKDFADTVRARAQRDAGFRRELLRGAIESFLEGDIGTGKIVLRDYINATIGFERLAELTGIPSKSLMRMFGPTGNPLAGNLFDILGHLQRAEGIRVHTTMRRAAAKKTSPLERKRMTTRKAS